MKHPGQPQHANPVTQKIESYADNVYTKDITGENFIENTIHTTNLPNLLNRLPPESLQEPLLEMGFGEGIITELLLKSGYQVEIVEGSSRLSEMAQKKLGEKIRIHHSYFENFNPPYQFKTIMSLHVLEHVDDPLQIVSRMYDWCKPGGQTIAVVPNAESLHRQLAVLMGIQEKLDSLSPRDQLVGHQRVCTLEQFVSYFEKAGFRVQETFGYFLKIVPDNMMKTWPSNLLTSLTHISSQLPPRLLANIGVVAIKD